MYVVFATKPVIFAPVEVTVPILVPPLNTSYSVTPTLSVEAFQDKEAVVSVIAEAVQVVGTVGACVSPAEAFTFTVLETCVAVLPAASLTL